MNERAAPKVCILAAGTGSRLGTLTLEINKCLLPLGTSTALTLILEQFPADLPIVIAVGYKAELVQAYCQAVHSDRDITYVHVSPFEGPGAGPGFSLQCCEPHLRETPFFLTTADCLVTEPIPLLQENWIGVCPNDYSGLYSTARVDANANVVAFQNKSACDYEEAFIGLAYVHEPAVFWGELERQRGQDREYEFVSAWYSPTHYTSLRALPFTWMDTGCANGYAQTKSYFATQPLGMNKRISELTVNANGVLCKLCPDASKNALRIERARLLAPHTPVLSYEGRYACAYPWIDGHTLYDIDRVDVYEPFLNWCEEHLWKWRAIIADFSTDCALFYQDKTQERYCTYKALHPDRTRHINGVDCAPIEELMLRMPWHLISQGIPVLFHGDLQFQNILLDTQGRYRLIDWRESFGRRSDYGDLYYDLAKLYGGILLPYNRIEEMAATLTEAGEECRYGVLRSPALEEFQSIFEAWVVAHHYDLTRIKLLAALVWLNMAPLHVAPVDRLLFAYAQQALQQLLST